MERQALEAIRDRINSALPMRTQREFMGLTSAHCEPVEKLLMELRGMAEKALTASMLKQATADGLLPER